MSNKTFDYKKIIKEALQEVVLNGSVVAKGDKAVIIDNDVIVQKVKTDGKNREYLKKNQVFLFDEDEPYMSVRKNNDGIYETCRIFKDEDGSNEDFMYKNTEDKGFRIGMSFKNDVLFNDKKSFRISVCSKRESGVNAQETNYNDLFENFTPNTSKIKLEDYNLDDIGVVYYNVVTSFWTISKDNLFLKNVVKISDDVLANNKYLFVAIKPIDYNYCNVNVYSKDILNADSIDNASNCLIATLSNQYMSDIGTYLKRSIKKDYYRGDTDGSQPMFLFRIHDKDNPPKKPYTLKVDTDDFKSLKLYILNGRYNNTDRFLIYNTVSSYNNDYFFIKKSILGEYNLIDSVSYNKEDLELVTKIISPDLNNYKLNIRFTKKNGYNDNLKYDFKNTYLIDDIQKYLTDTNTSEYTLITMWSSIDLYVNLKSKLNIDTKSNTPKIQRHGWKGLGIKEKAFSSLFNDCYITDNRDKYRDKPMLTMWEVNPYKAEDYKAFLLFMCRLSGGVVSYNDIDTLKKYFYWTIGDIVNIIKPEFETYLKNIIKNNTGE